MNRTLIKNYYTLWECNDHIKMTCVQSDVAQSDMYFTELLIGNSLML